METTAKRTDADLRQVLDELSYPTDKVRLVSCAEVHDLSHAVRRRLHALPHRLYSSATEVVAALPAGPAAD
jgi:hypothetical protein